MKKIFCTLIVFVMIIILGVILYTYKNEIKDLFFKGHEISNNKVNNKIDSEVKEEYSEYKKTSNFKLENLDRYIAYNENNSNLSYEDVVTFVNIGLDYKFYDYIKDSDLTLGNLILVNKYFKLNEDYEPSTLEKISSDCFINGNTEVRKLTKDAKNAFEKLCKDSIENGTPVYGQSAYRPYEMQEKLYNSAVSSGGVDYADSDTARPGHSEHQTGLAIDVSSTKSGNMLSFENTTSYTWMMENAHKYGFILRYTKDKENIHGYINEPWHFRYVGIDIATDIHDNYSDLTYEEYFYKYIDSNN